LNPAPNRAFIIHGYLGFPEEAWLPWLKSELEKRGYEVRLPLMPNPDHPTIPAWTDFIAKLVGEPDGKTVMIAHSLGCQAVLHYLEALADSGKEVGKTVLVAARFPSGMTPREAEKQTEGDKALLPWLTSAVDPKKVGRAAGKCVVILSDNDPYIPCDKALASFRGKLPATIVIEHARGHFNEDDKVNELPSALAAVIS
jgi:predicted alpha/beta hydrolase family esterase